MKIFTSISYYKPHISGLTVCVRRLIDGLSKKDFEFTVLTSRNRNNLLKNETENNVKIIRSPVLFTLGKVPVMPWYLFQAFRDIKENDLVWIHLPQAEGLIVAVAAKLFGKKVVTTVHCLPLLPGGWQRVLFQKLFDLLNNLAIRLADKVVYYTKDYAENTPELWHFPEKSSYILPPIPEAKGRRKREEGRRRGEFLIVGFAGRVAEDKGFEYLVEAMEILMRQGEKIKLLVAGPKDAVGERNYVKKIDRLLSQKQLDIKFLGAVMPDNMADFYRQIDCLVLPSVNRTEAFGIVQVEAMKCGVPVAASDLPGVRIPIQRTGLGQLFPAGDSMALAKVIDEVLARRWDQQDVIKRVKQHFQLQESLLRYGRILQRTKNRLMDY